MACSWEIDAQGSYGLYLNMIIYRVDANEDTKYNHFAYYTNQDRKSKRYLRFGKPKNLVCSLTLSIFELDIDSWYFFKWSKRTEGPWNSTKLYFSLEWELRFQKLCLMMILGNSVEIYFNESDPFEVEASGVASCYDKIILQVLIYDLSESVFKFWVTMLGY